MKKSSGLNLIQICYKNNNGQNDFPTDNNGTSKTHAQKTNQNHNLLFQNKQDLKN